MAWDSTYRRRALASLEQDRSEWIKQTIQWLTTRRNLTSNWLVYGSFTILLNLLEKT